MNRMPTLFFGVFLTFALAWVGLVVVPYRQLANLESVVTDEGQILPPPETGAIAEGRKVYQAHGCVYCHSQQIRPFYEGDSNRYSNLDIRRGWGERRTVARDYINEKPVLLGTMRTGPDLTNIGARQKDPNWHYIHMYNPRLIYPDSNMPAYPFLFVKRQVMGEPSPDAIQLPGGAKVEAGHEVVPTAECKVLVAYLLSLDRSYALPEAGVKK